MPTPQKPLEDAIVALTIDTAGLYGDPFFHRLGGYSFHQATRNA